MSQECNAKELSDNDVIALTHCHPSTDGNVVDKHARKRLIFASLLCVTFMIAEIVGGLFANSLAIATDAAHLLTDFASFMISLFSLWLATRPATQKMSFGWYRAEVVGALTSVLMIWVVTGILVYIAIERLISGKYEIQALIMMITASLGVLVNIIMGAALHLGGLPHGHSHGSDSSHSHKHNHSHEKNNGKQNINVRAAFIHVLGDFFQSVGVLIAAIVIYFKPEWQFIDPICTFVFSIIVLFTTFNIIKDTLNVIMEGMPKGIDFLEVQKMLNEIPGVLKVHNLRIWSLSLDKTALAAHLAINDNSNPTLVLNTALTQINSRFNVFESIIQVEEYKDEMNNCLKCKDPDCIDYIPIQY